MPITHQILWTPEMIKAAAEMRAARVNIQDVIRRLGVSRAAFDRARRLKLVDWPIPERAPKPRATRCLNGHDLKTYGRLVKSGSTKDGYVRCHVCHLARQKSYRRLKRKDS